MVANGFVKLGASVKYCRFSPKQEIRAVAMNDQEQARILEELDIILAGTSEPLWMVGVSKTKSSQGAGTAEAFEGIESTDSAKFGELHARQGMAEARRRESLEGHIDPSDKSFGGEVGAALKASESIRLVDKEASPRKAKESAREQKKDDEKATDRAREHQKEVRRRAKLVGSRYPAESSRDQEQEEEGRAVEGGA